MVTTRSQHAKHAEGSRSFAPLLDRVKARTAKHPAQLPGNLPAVVHTNRLLNLDQSSKIYSKKVRQARIARMVSQVLGPCRVFCGSVTIPDGQTARQSDADRLSDVQGAIDAGHAAIYWTDGSYVCHSETGGFSGAGVVCNVNGIMGSRSYTLQRYMGKSQEAELFAIAAALAWARSELRSGKDIRLVRVYSDSMSVLRSLMNGTCCSLGPMQGRKTAIEYVHDLADFLKDGGVTLELIWVKGHSGSEGNHLADRAAVKGVRDGIALLDPENPEDNAFSRSIATEVDVPDIWKELGKDWVQEWLARANVSPETLEMRDELKEARRGVKAQHDRHSETYQSNLAGNGGDVINFDSVNLNRNFSLDGCILDLLKSNLTLDDFIRGLRIQWSSIDAHVEELEIAVAENGGEGLALQEMRQGFIDEARPLYDQRAYIEKSILAHTAMRTDLAKQVEDKMVAVEGRDEVETGNDEGLEEEERCIGPSLLTQLEDLALSDTDDELERQIQDDIALAQRHR